MAALSPELAPEDLLPALARNVVTNGYQAGGGNEGLEPTEYLKLVRPVPFASSRVGESGGR